MASKRAGCYGHAMRAMAFAAGVCLALGCSATEGPLLLATDAGRSQPFALGPGAGAGAAAASAATASRVRVRMSLQYQLTGSIDTSVDAQLFVIDLFDASSQQIADLHAAGRVVIAYLSAGSLEPWREDAARFPRAAVGSSLADYPNESWLDIRSSQVRSLIAARLDRARDKGFDGVFPTTLGAYKATTGFQLTIADQLDYDRFLASEARARGLSPGLAGDFDIAQQLTASFDWALAIGCVADASCDQLGAMIAQAKPIFDLETRGQRDSVCSQAARLGIPTTLKHPGYDAWRDPCP